MPKWVYVLAIVITVGVILWFSTPNQYTPVKSPDSVPEVETTVALSRTVRSVSVQETKPTDPEGVSPGIKLIHDFFSSGDINWTVTRPF